MQPNLSVHGERFYSFRKVEKLKISRLSITLIKNWKKNSQKKPQKAQRKKIRAEFSTWKFYSRKEQQNTQIGSLNSLVKLTNVW